MFITVQLPDGLQKQMGIADNTLVYDGYEFKEPSDLVYAMLYAVDTPALSVPYKEVPAEQLSVAQRIRAKVVGKDPQQSPTSDGSLVVAADPTDGVCLCGLTCTGTEIRFAKVYNVEV
jgi:hypothetical protein